MTRRQALIGYGALLGTSRLSQSQVSDVTAPVSQLLNAGEFDTAAQRKLSPVLYREIAGGDRKAFERITFRPRLMVNTTKLDLTVDLFGQSLFAPIIVGPVSEQKRFHPDGELATVRGASAAKAVMVVSSRSSQPVDRIASESKTVLWYQVFPEPDMLTRAQEAVKAGCKAVVVTVGASKDSLDWKAIGDMRSKLGVPLIVKGIMTPDEASAAAKNGVQGIVVSSYTGHRENGIASPIEVLPAIAEAAGTRTQILIDGSFRRGSDLLKALALGARAVLLGRPVMWALASYGADGVQRLLELLQTELARDMAMCGRVNLQSVDRTVVKIHRA